MRPVLLRLDRGKLLLAIVLAVAVGLALAPGVIRAGELKGNERGGPVVVGGLPCMVNPELDLMFGPAFGNPGGVPVGASATLGLVGPVLFDGLLLNAHGTPFGQVNSLAYRILGLVNDGELMLSRAGIRSGAVAVWQWVPEGYVGGTIKAQTSLGTQAYPITSHCFPLPLAVLAGAPGTVFGTYTISPGPQHATLGEKVVVATAFGTQLEVQYQP